MWKIRCVCPFDDDDGFTIQCENCEVWQHAVCFEISSENVPENYLCEQCQPRAVDTDRAHQVQLERINQETLLKAVPRRRPHTTKARSHSNSRHASSSSTSLPHQVSHNSSNTSSGFISAPPAPNNHTAPNTNGRRKRTSNISPPLPEMQNTNAAHASSIPYSPHLEYVPLQSNTYSVEALEYAQSLSGLDTPNVTGEHIDDPCYVASVQPKSFCSSRFGLFTSRQLVPDQPVTEIIGRIFTQREYKRDLKNQYPLLGVPKPHVYFDEKSDLVIDARVAGSKSRFVRRSCQPNCTVISYQNEADAFAPSFYLVPVKPIESESELTVDWTFDAAHPFQCFANDDTIPSFTSDERERLSFILSSITSNADCVFADKRNCLFSKIIRFIKFPQRYGSSKKTRSPISNTTSFCNVSHENPLSNSLDEDIKDVKNQSVKSLKQTWLAKYQSLKTHSVQLKESVGGKQDYDVSPTITNEVDEKAVTKENLKMVAEHNNVSKLPAFNMEVAEKKAVSPTPPSPSTSHTPKAYDMSPKSDGSRKDMEVHVSSHIQESADITPLTPPHGTNTYDMYDDSSIDPERRNPLENTLLSSKEDEIEMDMDMTVNNNRRKMTTEYKPQTKRRRSGIHNKSPPRSSSVRYSRKSTGTGDLSLLSVSPNSERTCNPSDSVTYNHVAGESVKSSELSFTGNVNSEENLVVSNTPESTKLAVNTRVNCSPQRGNIEPDTLLDKSTIVKGDIPHNNSIEMPQSNSSGKSTTPSFSKSLSRKHNNMESEHDVALGKDIDRRTNISSNDGLEKIPGPPSSAPPAPPPGPAPSPGPKKLSLSEYRQRRQEALKSKQPDSSGGINTAERRVPSAPSLNTAASTS
ncbi:histone lysine methyltransferase Set3 [Schizosaccharomyces octosporus yFS286]|uniref:Histone lysine methyltransferase Set3 n=1 Tax=Schizosaccharomyces octosporus (strain yFS286) TaxID=483514 RepID=S9RFE8_SCHOY|nr:histone lysine methyltransferase Set3 [Schizosaccharomyces octosporus yFS286]EPX72809.1 histone lysine methyltransferase Set3 [Schizosaccharomyces octosporus yFS286]